MKRIQVTSLCAGLMLSVVGMLNAHAQGTLLMFSVNMATNLAGGSFNPPAPAGTGSDVVDVRGAFNGWAPLPLVQQGTSSIWTNSTMDTGTISPTDWW